MNFPTWSIRNPIPVALLFILLAAAGLWGFHKLPVQHNPDLDLPTVDVTLTQPGAAPAQLETEVARRVEDSLATLSNLRHLRTTITNGQVAIAVEFELEKSLSDALVETKNAVDSIRSDLPADVLPPTITAVTLGGDAVLIYAVNSAKMDEEALSWFVDDTVAKAVLAVKGVSRFDRVGGVKREARVQVDPIRLAALGINAADVSRALRMVEQQSSGGRGQLGTVEQSVRTDATVRQASDLAAFPIALPSGREVRLDQIAKIYDTNEERTQAAEFDGRPAVGFKIYRAKGYGEPTIQEDVAAALAKLAQANPGLRFNHVAGSVNYTKEQFSGSMHILWEGAVLAVVVVWAFLRNWRATLIAAAALPLSILPAFAAMSWLGYSLNTVTLLALAVLVGILVDDAIVEIENIERHAASGKPILRAAEEAVIEIALAVTATTMSLVVVFLPTAFMPGTPGLIFKEFGWTAVIAVLSSLLVARLLTPMMAAYLLPSHPPQTAAKGDGIVMCLYLMTLTWCLEHRKTTSIAAVAFFIGSVALIPLVPKGLIPPADRGYLNVSIELPTGSSLDRTMAVARAASRAIKGVAGIESVFTTAGDPQQVETGGVTPGEVRRGTLILTLSDRAHRLRQSAIEAIVRQRLNEVPGARFSLGSGAPGEKMQLILASDNAGALKHTAEQLEHNLRTIPHLFNITSSATVERPEIVVRPDVRRAAERGVTTQAIGDAVRVATNGDFDAQTPRLNLDTRQVYIRVRVPDAARQDLGTLENVRVVGRDGPVPLASIAHLSLESGPAEIDRYDRHRFISVNADLGGLPLGTALAAAYELPAVKEMPSDVRLIQSGDSELSAELGAGFGGALIIGILAVYCVLVLLFRDFLQPATILSAIPLSLGGAFIALLLVHSQLSIPSMIGLVMLIGIVTKNSILLVEYAIVGRRDRHLSIRDAIVDACHKRARPIVMTSVAMMAGMLPIALGWGADASFRQPMAVAVIGGLFTSTALSLLVVPVVYTYVDAIEKFVVSAWSHGVFNKPVPASDMAVKPQAITLHADY